MNSLGQIKVETRSDGTLKLFDGELQVGSGSDIILLNKTNGILVGGLSTATAKFHVAMDGTTTIKGGTGGIIRTIGSDGVKLTDGTSELRIDGGFGTGVEFRYLNEYRGGLKFASNMILEADNGASLIISQKNSSGYVYLRGGIYWDTTDSKFKGLKDENSSPYVTQSWISSQNFATQPWVTSQINSAISSAISAHIAAYHSG